MLNLEDGWVGVALGSKAALSRVASLNHMHLDGERASASKAGHSHSTPWLESKRRIKSELILLSETGLLAYYFYSFKSDS